MNMIKSLNGNKKKVIGWGSGGVIAFILVNLYSMTGKVNATEARVEAQGVVVQELKKMPVQVAKINGTVVAMVDDLDEFKTEQRKTNGKMMDKLDRLLER